MEYVYQRLHPGSKARYLLNGIRCDKLSTALAAVRAHPDKYEKDFYAVVTFLTQYIDKRAPTQSMKLHLLCKQDLQSRRRPMLVMALSKERSS